MPVCPFCHTEYREGFTICSDCGVPLIDSRTYDRQYPYTKSDDSTFGRDVIYEEMFLANIIDVVELAYIRSELNKHGIPYRILAEDVSQYLYIIHGFSYLGVNIFVSKDDIPEAQEVLLSYRSLLFADGGTSELFESVPLPEIRRYLHCRRILLIIFIFLYIGVII